MHITTSNLISDKSHTASPWSALTVISMSIFLTVTVGTSVNVILPTLEQMFAVSLAQVQWVVLGFLLSTTALLPAAGRLGDMLNKKYLFVAGLVVFGLGSLLCGLAPTLNLLVAARLFQGIGTALINALSYAIVVDIFPEKTQGQALGICGAINAAAIVVGPALGGLVLAWLSWRWVFLVNVPLSLLMALVTPQLIPTLPVVPRQRFDLVGAFLVIAVLSTFLIALTALQERGLGYPPGWWLIVISSSLLVSFIIWQAHSDQPLMDLTLFQQPLFSIGLAVQLIVVATVTAFFFALPFVLENSLALAGLTMGLILTAAPVAQMISAPVAGVLSDRSSRHLVVTGGLLFLIAGYGLMGTLKETTSLVNIVSYLLLIGLGVGSFTTPNIAMVMKCVPRHRNSLASSTLALSKRFAQALGVAVLSAWWSFLIRTIGNRSEPVTTTAQLLGFQRFSFSLAGLVILAAFLNIISGHIASKGSRKIGR